MNFVRNLNTRPIWRESISNLSWYHKAYLVDCKLLSGCSLAFFMDFFPFPGGVAWFMWLAAELLRWIPVHERDFAPDDPIISHPHTHEQ